MANPFRLPMARRTLRGLVSKPPTRQYPVELRDPFPGARGTLEYDLDTCNFCMLCARKCPTGAITCLRDERYFAIDQLNCIACGICVDVCAKDSLHLAVATRPVQMAADRGADGHRPGLQEWHGVIPEPKPEAKGGAKAAEPKAVETKAVEPRAAETKAVEPRAAEAVAVSVAGATVPPEPRT